MQNELRPVFEGFRLISVHVENEDEKRVRNEAWTFEVKRDIEIGLAFPKVETAPILAIVHVKFSAEAHPESGRPAKTKIDAKYQAIFQFSVGVKKETVDEAMKSDDNLQYLLSSQAAPLAVDNFKRLLQVSGFDPNIVGVGV